MNDRDAPPMYRMPVHFGPMPGPRQAPGGGRHDWSDNPERLSMAVHFLTDAAPLEALLPEGFCLDGEPVVTVEVQNLRKLRWLAGRGYNTLGIRFPARFEGTRDRARGPFLAVLWEDLADPIISGREELGYNKLYCRIDGPAAEGSGYRVSASWLGFRFLEMTGARFSTVSTVSTEASGDRPRTEKGQPPVLAGTLHRKYIPATGRWGEAEIDYPVLTPPQANMRVIERQAGAGRVSFAPGAWDDLPTLHHIVAFLADLPVRDWRGADLIRSVGGDDLYRQRRLS